MQEPTTDISPAFEMKGSMFTLSVLNLLTHDFEAIKAQFVEHIKKAPNFFKNMPVVIDLKELSEEEAEIDFTSIQLFLREQGLIPIGVRHGNDAHNSAAQAIQLAVLSPETVAQKPRKGDAKGKNPGTPTEAPQIGKAPENLVISHPVRSGQQIHARNANLIVLSSVSHGAELIADGSIHVYGHLRGRALAGAQGDASSRIFCQKLEAELVSIAGYYKLRDDLPADFNADATVQIYLDDKQIYIKPIS